MEFSKLIAYLLQKGKFADAALPFCTMALKSVDCEQLQNGNKFNQIRNTL